MDGVVSRWGDPQLDFNDRFYINTPGFINMNRCFFVDKNGNMVGITSNEMDYINTVMSFKFDVDGSKARPPMDDISAIMGKSREAVRQIKTGLIEIGALNVIFDDKRNKPDVNEFPELVRQCKFWHQYWITNEDFKDDYIRGHIGTIINYIKSEDGQKELHNILKALSEFETELDDMGTRKRVPGGTRKRVPGVQENVGQRIRTEEEIKDSSLSSDNEGGHSDLPKRIKSGDSKPKTAITLEDKQNTDKQKHLIEWVQLILQFTTHADIDLSGEKWGYVFKNYRRECSAASDMIELTSVKNTKGLTPRQIFDSFVGVNRDGWLFRKNGGGMSPGLTFSAEKLLEYFRKYVLTPDSCFNTQSQQGINTEDPIVVQYNDASRQQMLEILERNRKKYKTDDDDTVS